MSGTVTVFGGTGFLGGRVVRRVREKGFPVRVATRHPDHGRSLFGSADPQVQSIGADIHEDGSVARAVEGAYGVVNAVSLYVERGKETFQAVHVAAAERLAGQARKAGVERLAQVSGIGADARSPSAYIRARGEGEQAVRQAFAEATVIRPAVMFGPDDAFLNTMLSLMRWLPVYPMFGRGETRLQPAFVRRARRPASPLTPRLRHAPQSGAKHRAPSRARRSCTRRSQAMGRARRWSG